MANILEGDKQYMRLRSSTLFDVYRPVDLEREQETINRITSVSLRTFGSPQPSPPVNSLTRGSSLPSLHQTLSIRHPPLSPIGSRRRSESADSNSTTGRKTLRLLRREETLDIVVVDLKEEEEGVEIELEEEDTKEEDKLDVLMIKPSPKNLNRVTMSEDAMADFECPIFKRHNDEDLDETLREARKEQEKKKMFETSVEKGFFFRPSFDDGDL